MTLDELIAAPVADQLLQPEANGNNAPKFVELVSRPHRQGIVAHTLSVAALMAVLSAIPIGLLTADVIIYRRYSIFLVVGVLAALAVTFLITGILVSFNTRRKSQQAVAANERVLMSQGLSGVVIRWQEVRAWGILPAAADKKQPAIYVVMSETRSIIWSEPDDADSDGPVRNDDRREAYRARAAQLHAMIAARTGLSLREIRLESDITANVVTIQDGLAAAGRLGA